ncbi:MAG: hypothetical protein K6F53_09120 [Lachnospiraceae bacterium]|nr:hypothetical protein [Lachnospiraceae bacterium]
MATQSIKKAGTIIYSANSDAVGTLDIVVKGTVRAYNSHCSIDMPAGSLIGIGEMPQSLYLFNYEAADDVVLFSYPYHSEADLVALFKANPKLISMLVAGSVRYAHNLHTSILDCMEFARTEYDRIRECQEDYPKAAIAAGATVMDFPELNKLNPPDLRDTAYGWHSDFIDDLFTNEAKFRVDVYPIVSIGLGLGLTVCSYALEMSRFLSVIFAYLDQLEKLTASFIEEYELIKSGKKKEKQDSEVAEELGRINDISVNNCIGTLYEFGRFDNSLFERFRDNLDHFKKLKDRYGNDDDARKLRREITADFYLIYEAVFLQTIDVPFFALPMGIRLFLMFGFVDEKLAGIGNTKKLVAIINSYHPDKAGHVLSMYEWLMQVYKGKLMPSKNEFDLDYPSYLKELKRNGDINDAKEKMLLENSLEKFRFELKNLCTMGNRVTFGRISSFVAVFDEKNVLKPLEAAYLDENAVMEQIDRIRSIDFNTFYRQTVYSNVKAGINNYFYSTEILPYVILMPNVGSRAALWQEIDGKKRTTPARMLISVFHTENVEDTFTKMIAEFRWEICKTEQGVHWNDVTDPSLTSLYSDYLQFYRKNSSLSQEIKEKLSASLKNHSNSFKKVFVADYLTYIKYESTGALRLNKVAREILFTFCPFERSLRESLTDNPQFVPLLSAFKLKNAQAMKLLQNLKVKLEKNNLPVPKEILKQEEYLNH